MGDIPQTRWYRFCRWWWRYETLVLQVFIVLCVLGMIAIPYKSEIKRFLLALLLALSGCATADDARFTMHPDASGNAVEVLELTQHCPEAIVDAANGGCAVVRPVRVIFYPKYDASARNHELDHVAGMRHSDWLDKCAVITVGGYTSWKVGTVICRANDGTYYQTEK